MMLTARTDYFK